MTVSVTTTASKWVPADRSHSKPGVLMNGVRWSIWTIHPTRKEAVSQGNQVQEGSRLFRVRVAKIAPRVAGHSWAVVIRRK